MNDLNLPEIHGEYKPDYSLSHLTWFKVGGPAKILFKPKDIDDLCYFLANYKGDLPLHTLGAGSNTIIRDGGYEGIIIKLGRNFTNIDILDNNRIQIGAGCLNFNAANFCKENSIKGFEFLVGIPGTIGGGIAMNAGSYGTEFKDILETVTCIDKKGNKKILKCQDFGFGYRHNSLKEDLIFVDATFKFEKGNMEEIKSRMEDITSERQKTQPVTQKTGGSTFANPEGKSAWKLVDEVGLRGYKIGGAQFSPLHCNFMINIGDATAKDLEDLGELAKARILEKFNINLKWEIKRIGIKT